MKIKRKQLRRLIQENLLLELFDSKAYPFNFESHLVKDAIGDILLQFEIPAASLNEAVGSFGCNQHSLGFITDQGAWISLTDNGLEDKELHVDWLIKNDYVDDEGSAEMPDDWIKVNNATSLLVTRPYRLSQEHINGLVEMWLECSSYLKWLQTNIEKKKVEVFGPPGSGPSMIFADYTIPEMIERFDKTGRLMDVFFNRLMESASPKKKNSIALTEAKLRNIIRNSIKKYSKEAELVLESRRARNWIAQQDAYFRDDFQKAYDAGVTNIPDLAFLKHPDAEEAVAEVAELFGYPDYDYDSIHPSWIDIVKQENSLDSYKEMVEDYLWDALSRSGLRPGYQDYQALQTFYNPKVRNILTANGVKELSDFEMSPLTAGESFADFMSQIKSAFIDEPKEQDPEQSPEAVALARPEGFKIIGNVDNFELIDPSTGRGSAHCAVGTSWCTKTGSTYKMYTESGNLRLYYVFNNTLEYPLNKIAIGIKDNKVQYGSYGGTTVTADNEGISDRASLELVLGKDNTVEILNTLLRYYESDMNSGKNKIANLNYLVFLRKLKNLTTTAARLQYYNDILYQIESSRNPDNHAIAKEPHVIRIVNKIAKDKELNKTEFYPELKQSIKEQVSDIVLSEEFGGSLPLDTITKFFDLFVITAKRENLDALYVFQTLAEKVSQSRRENANEFPEILQSKMINLGAEANDEIDNDIKKILKKIKDTTDPEEIRKLRRYGRPFHNYQSEIEELESTRKEIAAAINSYSSKSKN